MTRVRRLCGLWWGLRKFRVEIYSESVPSRKNVETKQRCFPCARAGVLEDGSAVDLKMPHIVTPDGHGISRNVFHHEFTDGHTTS